MDFTLKMMDAIQGMKEIPDKSIDLIFTDPPYGLDYNNGDLAMQWEKVFGGKKHKVKPNGIQNDGEAAAMELFENFLIESKRVLKKGACCCCCCGGGGPKPLFAKWTLLMDKYIGFKHAVVWDKPGLGMGIHFRRSYEFVLIAQNGDPAHRWNGGNNTSNVWRLPKIIPSKDQHPTQKPVELANKVIHIFSNEGDLVLDPFSGSGTTGVSCGYNNRNFIGFEIDERFYKMSMDRIQASYNQLSIFNQ